MTKNNEIENLKNLQKKLRLKTSNLKSKIPKFLITFLLITVCIVYFLESKLYPYFGTGLTFIKFMTAFFIIISLIYLLYMRNIINKNNAQIKKLSGKLYQLMKLEKTGNRE